jgi:hypothetical protein
LSSTAKGIKKISSGGAVGAKCSLRFKLVTLTDAQELRKKAMRAAVAGVVITGQRYFFQAQGVSLAGIFKTDISANQTRNLFSRDIPLSAF